MQPASDPAAPESPSLLARAAALGLEGARHNFLPGLGLWAVGLALVGGYYFVPAAKPVYETVRQWKLDGGFLFSTVSSAVCGGLIPFFYSLATGQVRRGDRFYLGAFFTLFWIYRGLEVDVFYRLQAMMFGSDPGVRTVALKAAVDMLVYTAWWSIPTTQLAYFYFLDCRMDFRRFRAGLNREFFFVKVPALIFAAWAVWAPSVCIIYSMPLALQVPLFCVVLCFWVLLVNVMAGKAARRG